MESKFKVIFQLNDDGKTVTSTTTVNVTDYDKKNEMEEGESEESYASRKLQDSLECDGYDGVGIISITPIIK